MKKIPLIKPDLPYLEEVESQFREIIEVGKITNFGKYVMEFEKKISEYIGAHVATVSSGTLGLILTLQALGLKPGQKVILPSFTFMATAQAVLYAGGIPVFAEIDQDLTISSSDLEMLLKKHEDVAIVLPVHTYGLPCRVNEIQEIVKEASFKYSRPISILYDAAHAFGSAIENQRVGVFGDAEVFSLSVTKVLVSVEGGVVSSINQELIEKIREMRNYGIKENYNTFRPGMNGKMSEFHAIIGLYNINRLNDLLEKRRVKAEYYIQKIKEKTNFQAPPMRDNVIHTFKDFTVITPDQLCNYRDQIVNFLKDKGIETRAYFYPPVHEQNFFKRFVNRPLPFTESISRKVITLPFYTTISEDEMDYVVETLKESERIFS
ncbi:MAG: DegT/DnrJ/EryC1/StrS family aminotransferase [Bacteroidetes bacterium]|nr:DegT/DnrJ/EryC1/StrS family aminotransferase [Rhodothermia bacterium]MCX7906597.1 DegT/DnrJ/EryC1/StrS family aminotransferase [Bacteroidota bacterium]MDW8285008.1 DegT/DnrJ/EryC1/StrS family aminotransferase [Bacteroidota bacterium]